MFNRQSGGDVSEVVSHEGPGVTICLKCKALEIAGAGGILVQTWAPPRKQHCVTRSHSAVHRKCNPTKYNGAVHLQGSPSDESQEADLTRRGGRPLEWRLFLESSTRTVRSSAVACRVTTGHARKTTTSARLGAAKLCVRPR